MKHCCTQINFLLEEQGIPITYSPNIRQYGIWTYSSVIGSWEDFKKLPVEGSYQTIFFCPWCGKKLPTLKNKWFAELEKLGFQNPFEEKIPEEFTTDEWWRKGTKRKSIVAPKETKAKKAPVKKTAKKK